MRPFIQWSLCCGIIALGLSLPRAVSAVTPDSPEVKSTIAKALKYLEQADDPRLGGKCLIGMAFLKNGADESHPKVAAAVASCQAHAKAATVGADIYSTGIAIIFLCSLNPSKYSAEILKYKESLESRQKPHGGWGYPGPDKTTGDTSMTQYAVLAYWEMQAVGFPPEVASTEKVANWLLRTQDPGGNWGYQGKEGESVGTGKVELVKQDSAKPGMTAAGLGCTYMVADLLKLSEFNAAKDASLPEALRPVLQGGQKALTDKVDLRLLRSAQSRGKEWMKENYKVDPGGFVHYWLYALERYQSFREAAEGNKDNSWYNDGYRYLRENQERDGSFPGEQEGFEAVNTAFGALFLLRSTKKAIERSKSFGEASLLAGRGLPGAAEVRVRAGQIVPKEVTLTTDQMIEALFQPDSPQYSGVAADVVVLSERIQAAPAADQAEYLAKLRTLAATGGRAARLAAVRVLGRLRDIDSGPTLILALDDADWQVVQAADEALQMLGRKLAAAELGEIPDPMRRSAAIKSWKEWYVAIRPDAEFDN